MAAAQSALRSSPGKAVLYMLGAVTCLSGMDAGIKWLTADYSVPQVAFMRYLVGLLVALAIAARMGGLGTLKTRRPGGHLLRSALNLGTMLTFYYALRLLPLADTFAVGYAAPLFMTVLSVPLLKEKVGPRRWAAVCLGFLGVLVLLQPSGTGFNAGSMLALTSAFLYALTIITSRQLSATEASHTILFYYSVCVIVALGLTMPWNWTTPPWQDLWLVLTVGLAGSFGQFFLNQAFRYGEVSLLAPLDYTGMIWGVLFGFVLWGDLPTAGVLIGAAIIALCSVYIVRREALRRRAPELLAPIE
jgi:drug/metabolite transporter (DMT)-like permease